MLQFKALRTGILSFIITGIISNSADAQQIIRGRVTDMQSKTPVAHAYIVSSDSNSQLSGISDSLGYFVIKEAPIGRVSLRISCVGYQEQQIANILVTSGKETFLSVELSENVVQVSGVSIKGSRKGILNNNNVTLSARSFDIEDTRRFAGSRNDPARMASNFAGVVGNNDSRNDIIVRGNSPQGLLWRFEGVDIPNPSHFGAMGATGGPVSILNNNVLAKSDFLTGAFPAMYGNANAGVFDLQMRAGNSAKREYTGQIGINGFELGAEGPFNTRSKASYLIYYRYSTLAVMQKMGFNFGTGTAIPYYQDITFKVNIPVKKNLLTVFGIGGTSKINLLSDKDADSSNFYANENQNLNYKTNMGVAGISYMHFFNNRLYGKIIIAGTGTRVRTLADSVPPSGSPIPYYRDNSVLTRLSVHAFINRKFSARNNLTTGIMSQQMGFNFNDSVLVNGISFRRLRHDKGQTQLLQSYVQWQHKFNNNLVLNTGIHYQLLDINNSQAIEPRIGLSWYVSKKSTLSIAYGMHNQMQPLQVYFLKTKLSDNQYIQTNKSLGFTRSNHYVLAYSLRVNRYWQLKTEAYYQGLSNVPVTQSASYYSTINEGADFNNPDTDSLVNKGSGNNKGVELTLERYFNKGFYMLGSASLYDARYKGSNGIERPTAFNGGYIINLLAGKEIKLSDKHTLAFDTKITYAGGRRYTPIDLAASSIAHRQRLIETEAFGSQFAPYFRTDFKVTFRRNGRHITQEFYLDIQNITNHKNVFTQNYSAQQNKILTQYQLGLYPLFNYRITF